MKSKYPGVYKSESGDNKYVLRMCITVNGQTHRDTRTVTASSEKKAYDLKIKLMDELAEKYRTGKLAKYAEMTFEELVDLWKNTVEKQVGTDEGLAYSTYYTYLSILNKYIIPYFTGVSIHEIDKGSLNFYRDYLRSEYELSEKTINNQMMLIRTICTFAEDRNMIAVSWFSGFKNTKLEEPDIEYFTSQQIRNILELIEQEVEEVKELNDKSIKYNKLEEAERIRKQNKRILAIMAKQAFINISVFSGARRGEIIGLDWDNIHLEDDAYIEFRGTAYNKIGEGSQKKNTLKNGTKSKKVYISAELASMLSRYKELQKLVIKENGYKNKGYVFITLTGGTNKPAGSRGNGNSYTEWFDDWAEANKEFIGFSDEDADKAHLHCFRHSFVTNLLSSGADVKTVASLAGHKDANVTLKKYSHAVEDNMKNANSILTALYGSTENEK